MTEIEKGSDDQMTEDQRRHVVDRLGEDLAAMAAEEARVNAASTEEEAES